VKFEDMSTLGRFQRLVEIDAIHDANEQHTERYASRERTKDVAKEPDSLCRVQAGRAGPNPQARRCDDPPALDRQGQDRKWTPVGRPGHAPGYPVQEDPRRRFGELTEEHRLLGNGLRAADQRDQTRTRHPAVGAPHDLRVGDGEQAFEVTGTRRHEEGVPMTR